MRFSDTPSTVQRPPWLPGEHTLEIMRWLGYEDSSIDDFLRRGILATG
jgi:crotonobetainyl-CoA:carnitine CoA-transferase CaiB-like acyl-CoA transferase